MRRREISGHGVRDDPCALAGGQYGRVDAAPAHAQRRGSDRQQQHCRAGGHQDRTAHHAIGQPVPAALGFRGPGPADPAAEQHQQRRDDQQRAGRGDQRDHRAAEAHRDQEPLRENCQGCQRDRYRRRTEQDRPAGRGHRHPQGAFGAGVLPHFLTEPPHQEQAVVDGQAEPEADHQVQREDRQGQRHVDQPQDEEGGQHGRRAHGDGQQSRDPAEDEEGENRQQREGDRLGEAEVRLGLLAKLGSGDVRAAEQHVRPAVQGRFDIRDDGVRVGRGSQRGDHER